MEKEIRILSADTVNEFFAAFEKDWKRALKASQINPDNIKQIEPGSWLVGSQTSLGKYAVLQGKDGAWSCTCADHKNRLVNCKHILAVKATLETVEIPKNDYFDIC